MRTPGWMLAAALAAAGCGGSSSSYGGSSAPSPSQCTAATATAVTTIHLSGMEFVPACARVPVGTAITFQNDDSVAHTATSDAGQPETFDTGTIAPGTHATHTFSAPETEAIHCSIHSTMHATIVAVQGG